MATPASKKTDATRDRLNNEAETVVFNLRLPARPDRLKLVRAVVGETARMLGLGDETVHDLVIAVDEACQNVIRHAYGQGPVGDMAIEARRDGNQLVLLLRDWAAPVDKNNIRPRDLNDLRPGGLGTHFIREVMDEVDYLTPPEGGNLLKMIKTIEPTG